MTEKKLMKLEGNIVNLTAKDVVMVCEPSQLSTRFPVCRETRVMMVPDDVQVSHRSAVNAVPHTDDCLAVQGATGVVGTLNDVFDLVRPLGSCAELRDFWERAVQSRCARVDVPPARILGALSYGEWLESFGGMLSEATVVDEFGKRDQPEFFGIVSRGVALIAYYRGENIDRLLVPVMPVALGDERRERLKVGSEVSEGYRALMPAKYLLE